MIDISARMREMREKIPPSMRTVGTMYGVAAATEGYARAAQETLLRQYSDQNIEELKNIWDAGAGHMAWLLTQIKIIAPQVEIILRDLDAIRLRIHTIYLPALRKLPDDAPMPKAVYPLFYNVPGTRWLGEMFFMPDALGPATALNQWAELSGVNQQLIGAWGPIYFETLTEIVKEKAKEAGEAAKEPLEDILLAAAGVALVGVVIYAATRGLSEGSSS